MLSGLMPKEMGQSAAVKKLPDKDTNFIVFVKHFFNKALIIDHSEFSGEIVGMLLKELPVPWDS